MNAPAMDVADILHGYAEIGGLFRISAGSAKHRTLEGHLPMFKLGWIVCARKPSLITWMAEQEAKARGAA